MVGALTRCPGQIRRQGLRFHRIGAVIGALGCRSGLATGVGPRSVGLSAKAAVVGGIVATTAPMPTPTPAGAVTARRAALAKVLAQLAGMLARYA